MDVTNAGPHLAPVDQHEEEQDGEPGADLGGDGDGEDQEAQAQEEIDAEEEAVQPRGARDPGQPTRAEREEHELTHIQYRPWCEACVRGKAKRRPSLRISGAYSHSCNPRVRMDYALLTENEVASSDETGETSAAPVEAIDGDDDCMTVLVMQESQHRSVWAYPVDKKGATEEWLSAQILEDLETMGLQGEKIVLKSDQEPAIVDVARDISRARQGAYGTAMETSAVGESDSNASVERAIQDVEGQARTLRAALVQRVQHKVRLRHPVVPWLVRHAAALITRYRVRPPGRTSLEMIKGRRSNAQITEFGEVILFKIPKTKLNPGKFEDQ